MLTRIAVFLSTTTFSADLHSQAFSLLLLRMAESPEFLLASGWDCFEKAVNLHGRRFGPGAKVSTSVNLESRDAGRKSFCHMTDIDRPLLSRPGFLQDWRRQALSADEHSRGMNAIFRRNEVHAKKSPTTGSGIRHGS